MQNYNKLTPDQTERLAILAEELGEVSQIIGKILRHGYESFNPLEEHSMTNRKLLEMELGDVLSAISRLASKNDLSIHAILERGEYKTQTAGKWLHHN